MANQYDHCSQSILEYIRRGIKIDVRIHKNTSQKSKSMKIILKRTKRANFKTKLNKLYVYVYITHTHTYARTHARTRTYITPYIKIIKNIIDQSDLPIIMGKMEWSPRRQEERINNIRDFCCTNNETQKMNFEKEWGKFYSFFKTTMC